MVEKADALESGVENGYRFKVVQTDLGHFCGYVKTNFGEQWSYADIRGHMSSLVDAHGGLTYGVDANGWVGFDCAHAGDQCIIDGVSQSDHAISADREWTPEDVAEECRKVAQQIDMLETFAETFGERGWDNDD